MQADYATVTQQLAAKALSIATDAAPHRAKQGERRWPMADALPAARVLVGQASEEDHAQVALSSRGLYEALADPMGKITDGFGHARPSYAPLAVHLLGTAGRLLDDAETLRNTREAGAVLCQRRDAAPADDPRFAYWYRLMAWQHGIATPGQEPCAPEEISPQPLAPLGLNDLIDSWTYDELVGLHGLHLVSLLEPDDALAARVRSAAEYHLGHTQPDYTTYQPWGLAAFASDVMTAVFAEQQLHDVATHLSIEGPGGAVMPALLLADNAAAMSGTLMRAWHR